MDKIYPPDTSWFEEEVNSNSATIENDEANRELENYDFMLISELLFFTPTFFSRASP
jgi:hypothetical protein